MRNSPTSQRVGIITGGGLAPGLNAVIYGAVRVLKDRGDTLVGIPEGWKGMLQVSKNTEVITDWTEHQLRTLLRKEGTVLKTSRTKINPALYEQVQNSAQEYGIDGLLAVGGDDTLTQGAALSEQGVLNIIGIPKTIDNDVQGTDQTFGFETAVEAAAQHIEGVRVEAEALGRVGLVEIMGREAGWIALYAGSVGGADITLIREFPMEEKRLFERIREIYDSQGYVVVAVAEGYGDIEDGQPDPFGHKKKGGIAKFLGTAIKDATGHETMSQVVGYHSRFIRPTAADTNLCHEMGALGGHLAHQREYGKLIALRSGEIVACPLNDAKRGRLVTSDYYDLETMSKWDLPPNIMRQVLRTQQSIRKTLGRQ